MTTGIELIAEERKRQIEIEGWTAEHDKIHSQGEIAHAAACYALPDHLHPLSVESGMITGVFLTVKRHAFWPWSRSWWKPTPHNRIKELAKAGALIAAEIDRIQAAELQRLPVNH